MSARYYKLLRGHSIIAFTGGENGRPFVRLFRSCWTMMPVAARRRILKHWRSGPNPTGPIIEFSNMWYDSNFNFGQVSNFGHEMRFSAADIILLPESVARWVIAHELAHVYQKAVGRNPGGASEEENESSADTIASNWGFDRTAELYFSFLRHSEKLSIADACKVMSRRQFTFSHG